jgi:hypothetical protein
VREEALKAMLILARPGWRKLIDAAETHGYFRGQIEFLFKFSGVLDRWLNDKSISWSNLEDAEYQYKFSYYFAKASAVFSKDGLKDFGENRWERALLMKGDYLLQRGANRSFLDNGERDANWKRLLRGSFKANPSIEQKRKCVRELLDEIDISKDIKESLDAVLAKPLPADLWRRAFIEHSEAIDYCWGRMVRWHYNGSIYLMRRIQMNGEHAELFTYCLKCGLLSKKHQADELSPFGVPQYRSVYGESEEPCVYLGWTRGNDIVALEIVNKNDSYSLRVSKPGGALPPEVRDALLNDAGFKIEATGELHLVVDRASIETAVDEIVSAVRRIHP